MGCFNAFSTESLGSLLRLILMAKHCSWLPRRALTSDLLCPCLEHSLALISYLKSHLFTSLHRSVDSICQVHWNLGQQVPQGRAGTCQLFPLVAFLQVFLLCPRLLLWSLYSPLLFLFFLDHFLPSHLPTDGTVEWLSSIHSSIYWVLLHAKRHTIVWVFSYSFLVLLFLKLWMLYVFMVKMQTVQKVVKWRAPSSH